MSHVILALKSSGFLLTWTNTLSGEVREASGGDGMRKKVLSKVSMRILILFHTLEPLNKLNIFEA